MRKDVGVLAPIFILLFEHSTVLDVLDVLETILICRRQVVIEKADVESANKLADWEIKCWKDRADPATQDLGEVSVESGFSSLPDIVGGLGTLDDWPQDDRGSTRAHSC